MFLPSLVFSFLLASQQAPAPLPVGTQIIPAGTWNLATGNQGSSRSPGPDTVYSCDGLWSWYSTHQSSSANSYQWAVTDEFRLADRISQNWEQLNGFSLNYCTDSIDPTGAGAQLQVSFYQDYTPCTSPGVPDCTYILSGLPLSMNGNATCWSISVDLSGMECMRLSDSCVLTCLW